MLLPPADIVALLRPFAPLFSRRVWRHVPLLVVGTILAPGRRMVSSVLRTVVDKGLNEQKPPEDILSETYVSNTFRRASSAWHFPLGFTLVALMCVAADSRHRSVPRWPHQSPWLISYRRRSDWWIRARRHYGW